MRKEYLKQLHDKAVELNHLNILKLASALKNIENFIDLGCDDGKWTLAVAQAARASSTHGLEIVAERATLAKNSGVSAVIGDLNQHLEFEDKSFDLVHANQVIEHVADVDHFAQEVFRILKPGGWAIISTENASSWHNIFALLLGWQMFSLTNMSGQGGGVGNPFALHRGTVHGFKSWTHKTIFSLRGLSEFFGIHGFKVIKSTGAGYYPFPALLGSLDKTHSHFITILIQKPL